MAEIHNVVLKYIREVKETTDIKELAAMLSTGEWIAIAAVECGEEEYLFVLGRVAIGF